MTDFYFGVPWNAPVCNNGQRRPTPVGTACMYCGIAVNEDDRGHLLPPVFDGRPLSELLVQSPAVIHRECMMRSIIGCLAAVRGLSCDCTERTEEETPQETYTEAINVYLYVTDPRLD